MIKLNKFLTFLFLSIFCFKATSQIKPPEDTFTACFLTSLDDGGVEFIKLLKLYEDELMKANGIANSTQSGYFTLLELLKKGEQELVLPGLLKTKMDQITPPNEDKLRSCYEQTRIRSLDNVNRITTLRNSKDFTHHKEYIQAMSGVMLENISKEQMDSLLYRLLVLTTFDRASLRFKKQTVEQTPEKK